MRFPLEVFDAVRANWPAHKPISLRIAHFAQFRHGKLRSIRVLLDAFDLVVQALGHSIHLPRMSVA